MNNIDTFEQFIATQSVQLPLINFIANMILAAILSSLLGYVYTKFGSSLSNRKSFSNNLILITLTTMVIITIVKSSLALSLGLVGALSIVRFRAAIKEPEELAYLFLSITIGLGCGADQIWPTIVSFIFICSIIIFRRYKNITLFSV